MDPPVDGVPVRHVLRSVHRHGVQLALRLGRLDQHQRSKAHLPTSAPFRAQPPGLVSGQLSRAVDGGVDHVAAGFLSSFDHRHSLVGHPAPAAEFRSPHGRPTKQPAPGPDGISTFRTSESRPDWVPSLPRGQRCSHDRSDPSGRRSPPLPGARPYHPGPHPISGAVNYEASSRVYSRSPARPSPSPGDPLDGSGALGLFPGLRTPTGRTCGARQGGGRASSTRPELHDRHRRTSNP